eukprot:7390779-Prymnesium_polylepis.2
MARTNFCDTDRFRGSLWAREDREVERDGAARRVELGGDGCHQLVTADGRELFTLNLSELVQ